MNKEFFNITVGRKDTRECTVKNFIVLDRYKIEKISRNELLSDEMEEYEDKERCIDLKVNQYFNNKASRRIYVTWMDDGGRFLNCISLVHLLLSRQKNTMNVYLRSIDAKRLKSDLTFLCRMAIKYNIDILQVMIGSLHSYI